MTADLLALADWLVERRVTHVAMESTGVYWKPVYNLLEGLELTLLVVNAPHIKAVPGRKTDVKDAEWIADLLRHGLLRGSFIPDRPQRELRELVRYRSCLVGERARAVNRIQKALEGANVKLGSVVSDVAGVSGRAMLTAEAQGTEDPQALAGLARGKLQQKRPALEQALRGLMGPHQRLLLQSHLRHLTFLDEEIARLDGEVAHRVGPFEPAIALADQVPGIGRRIGEIVVAEVGTDLKRFPTDAHFASWARLCPGNNERAGKRKSGRTGYGNRWLRSALIEAARAAAHTKNTYLSAQYHRIAARRGAKRAAVAVAHSILVIYYHLLTRGTCYEDLGPNYFDERDREGTVRRAVQRIRRLGYRVTVEVQEAA